MADVGSALTAAAQAAAKINALLAAKGKLNKRATPPAVSGDVSFSKEIEINDVPNPQRYSLTKSTFHDELLKDHEASISVRGRFFPPEEKEALLKKHPDLTKLDTNERPLYLVVQAKTALDLDRVVGRITVIIQEAVLRRPSTSSLPIPAAAPAPVQLPPSTRPLHYVQRKIFVGLESEEGFNVKEKLLGPGGTYLAHIVRETNARLQLRGRGSGYIEPTSGKEAFELLYIHASHPTQEGLNRAVQLCEDLIQSTRRQYDDFKRGPAVYAPQHPPYGASPWAPGPPPPAPYAAVPAAYGAPGMPPPPHVPYAPAVPPPPPAPAPYHTPMGPPPPPAPYGAAIPPPPPGVVGFMPPHAPYTPPPAPELAPEAPVSNAPSQTQSDDKTDQKSKKRRFVERAPSPPKRARPEPAPAAAPPVFAAPAPPAPKNDAGDVFKMPPPVKKKAAVTAGPSVGGAGLVDYGDDEDSD